MHASFFSKFATGMKIAYKSFGLLYKNKKLYIFFIIPALLILIEKLLVKTKYLSTNSLTIIKKFGEYYTIHCNGSTCTKIYNGWLYSMAAFSIFTFITIITLSVIAITQITNNMQKGERYEARKFVSSFIPKIKKGLVWASISFICIYGPTIFFSIYKIKPEISYVINSAISLTFLLFSAFIIQAIAIDNLNIYKALKRSINTIYLVFFEYLGIIFWISIISGILWLIFKILTLILFASGVTPGGPTGFYEISLYSIFTIIAAIATEIIIFTYDISKTLLFNNFKQKTLN